MPRRVFLIAGLLAALVPGAAASPACAGEGGRAGLVIDTGEGEHGFCVALPEEQVSGIELIVLAGEQHGLQYRLGYGGDAVCMLAGVGAQGDDCFEEYPDFWGYWRGDDAGGWSWSASGAGSTAVSDGDVEGWSWGRGNDGSSHPQPSTPVRFADICATAMAQQAEEGSAGRRPRSARSKSEGSVRTGERRARSLSVPEEEEVGASDATRPRSDKKTGRAYERTRARTSAPPPSSDQATPSVGSSGEIAAPVGRDDRDTPLVPIAAIAVTGTLAGLGLLASRRKRSP